MPKAAAKKKTPAKKTAKKAPPKKVIKKAAPAKKTAKKAAPKKATATKKTTAAKKKPVAKKAAAPKKKTATKKPAAKKATAKKATKKAPPPSPIKGLAGNAAPKAGNVGAIDAAAVIQLGGNAIVKLDARLALVDPSTNSDKYYVLQVLEASSGEFFCWQRWGRTGTSGQGKLGKGEKTISGAQNVFQDIFKKKTDVTYHAAVGGQANPIPGKYEWLALTSKGVKDGSQGKWEYYVDDGVDGKAVGWYPYHASAVPVVEDLYQTYVVNKNKTMGIRFVDSGTWTYKVDLTDPKNFTQTNVKHHAHTMRRIRRVVMKK